MEKEIEHIKKILSKSKTAKKLLQHAENNGVSIVLADIPPSKGAAFFNPAKNTITIGLNIGNNPVSAIAALAHELRHAWQFHEKVIPELNKKVEYIKTKKLDDGMLNMLPKIISEKRFTEADAYAAEAQIISELITENALNSNAWEIVPELIMPKHISEAFVKSAKEDIDNTSNGYARRKAFDSYFEHAELDKNKISVSSYDSVAINQFSGILLSSPSEFWQEFFSDPNSKEKLKNIFNISAADSKKEMININDITALGEMETGGNYITDCDTNNSNPEFYQKMHPVIDQAYDKVWDYSRKLSKTMYK